MSEIIIPPFADIEAKLLSGLKDWIENNAYTEPALIGIHSGGVTIAKRLHEKLGLNKPLGELDITFYRDDFTRIGIHPQVKTSNLPASLDDQTVILVDDVVQTGRTIRAAMNELFDYGRPAQICLVAGILRDGRELPIMPDVYGYHLPVSTDFQVKLSGTDELTFNTIKRS